MLTMHFNFILHVCMDGLTNLHNYCCSEVAMHLLIATTALYLSTNKNARRQLVQNSVVPNNLHLSNFSTANRTDAMGPGKLHTYLMRVI